MALLFSLWTETVRPYLEIVDEWIVHGHLFDPAKEFIIQRFVVKVSNSTFFPLLIFSLTSTLFFQKQGRPSKPQRLLARHLHSVQRVRDGGERGEAQRRGQRQLRRRAGMQQQAAHHGVLPQARPEADHHGREIHAAVEKSTQQGTRGAKEVLQRSASTPPTVTANLPSCIFDFLTKR